MSKYLIFSGGVLCGVLLVVVGVFVYVQTMLKPTGSAVVATTTPSQVTETVATVSPAGTAVTGTTPKSSTTVVSDAGPLLTEPIPLSRLPLTDTQKQLVSGLGIDYDTFMITPEMATCAEGRLGRDRVKELIAGSAPTFSEVAALARCL